MDKLRAEIHNKSLELKKKIKDLNNILSSLYNTEREKQNKNLYLFKRNIDKVISAAKHLEKVVINDTRKADSTGDDSLEKLQKQTLANLLKIESIYKEQLRKEILSSDSVEVPKIKRSIDSLRLAYDDLKRLDTVSDFKVKEPKVWKYKELGNE